MMRRSSRRSAVSAGTHEKKENSQIVNKELCSNVTAGLADSKNGKTGKEMAKTTTKLKSESDLATTFRSSKRLRASINPMISISSEDGTVAGSEDIKCESKELIEKEDIKSKRDTSEMLPVVKNDGKNEYERLREERMKANRERMMMFEVLESTANLAADVMATSNAPGKKASSRGLATAKKKKSTAQNQLEPVEIRRSARQRGAPVDYTGESVQSGEIDAIFYGKTKKDCNTNPAKDPNADLYGRVVKARDTEDIAFESLNAEKIEDDILLALLREDTSHSKSKRTGSAKKDDRSRETSINTLTTRKGKMSLCESDVAKVVKDGAAHIDFCEREDVLIVGCGDKRGHIGIWNIGSESENDGVLLYKPHMQYVSGMEWMGSQSSHPTGILTCSYDGTVRLLDCEHQKWLCLHATGAESGVRNEEDDEYSCMKSSGESLYLGDNQGNLHIMDMRVARGRSKKNNNQIQAMNIHNKKINTLSVHNNTLISSSSDATISLWDIRNIKKAVGNLNVSRTCQSAYFSPDGSGRVLVTCYDDSVQIWDCNQVLHFVVL